MSSPARKKSRQDSSKNGEKTSIEEEASARALLELKDAHEKAGIDKSSSKNTKKKDLAKSKKRRSSAGDSDDSNDSLSNSPGRQLHTEIATSSAQTSPAAIPRVRPTQKVFGSKKRKREVEPASSSNITMDDSVVDPLLMQGMAAVEAFNKEVDGLTDKSIESATQDGVEDHIQNQDTSALDDEPVPLPPSEKSTSSKKKKTKRKKEESTERTQSIVRDRLNHHVTSYNAQGKPNGGAFTPDEVETLDKFLVLYRHAQNPVMTQEELCARVWATDRPNDKFWDQVAEALPLRTRTSIYKHVRRAYHVYQVRGVWTPEDDAQLKDYVEELGTQWRKISEIMHRMPEDCRDRWRNYLKCGGQRNSDVWTHEEEDKLRDVINVCVEAILDLKEKAGTLPPVPDDETEEEAKLRLKQLRDSCQDEVNWNVVSEKMDGRRSRIQCRYKWNKMKHWPNGHNPLEERRNKTIVFDQDDKPPKGKKSKTSTAKKSKPKNDDTDSKDLTPVPISTTKEPTADLMLLGDKIWYLKQYVSQLAFLASLMEMKLTSLVPRIQQQLSVTPLMKSIDWNLIAESDTIKLWTASSYKESFESLLKAMSMKSSHKLLAKNIRELLEAFEDMPIMLVEQRYQPTSPMDHTFVANTPVTYDVSHEEPAISSDDVPLVDASQSPNLEDSSRDQIQGLDDDMESMNMSSVTRPEIQVPASSPVQNVKPKKSKSAKSVKSVNKKSKKGANQARPDNSSQPIDGDDEVNEGILGATAKAAMRYVNDAATGEDVIMDGGKEHDVEYDSEGNT